MKSKQRLIFNSNASKLRPPCKDCEKRCVNCHKVCEPYTKYQEEINAIYKKNEIAYKSQITIKVDKRRRVW